MSYLENLCKYGMMIQIAYDSKLGYYCDLWDTVNNERVGTTFGPTIKAAVQQLQEDNIGWHLVMERKAKKPSSLK
jgi:hypothetical protein